MTQTTVLKHLYEARKVESKLAQRQMLGIVNPSSLVSVDAIKKNFKGHHGNDQKCDYCGQSHKWGKRNCPAFGKTCDKCGQKNHFKTVCKSSEGSMQNMIQGKGQIGPRENVHIDAVYMKFTKIVIMTML